MEPPSNSKPKAAPPPPLLPILCISDETDRPSTSKNTDTVCAMAGRHHKWTEYRGERTSSSSSDSGVAVQFSPTQNLLNHSVSSVLALSPPGLSPLTVHDSAFPTPTSTQAANRFTFDHVPFRKQQQAEPSKKTDLLASAFDIPSSSKMQENLTEILRQVREPESTNGHPALTRKRSVIHSTATQQSVSRSDSMPLAVAIHDGSADARYTQLLLSALQRPSHCLLSPSLSSPISSNDSRLGPPSPHLQVSPHSDKSPLSVSSETLDDDDKKHICEFCLKDFKRPDILSRHVRRHTGEKPFGCEDCGRFFSRSDHLRTHKRTHTDEKPYECTICDYAARRRDVLTRHMSTRHQAKAGISIFQRHREVRRCLSDGDHGAASLANASQQAPPPNSPKRLRHNTEVPKGEVRGQYRDRTYTEMAPGNNNSSEDFPSFNEIENDVIIDVCDVVEDSDEEMAD